MLVVDDTGGDDGENCDDGGGVDGDVRRDDDRVNDVRGDVHGGDGEVRDDVCDAHDDQTHLLPVHCDDCYDVHAPNASPAIQQKQLTLVVEHVHCH